MRGDMTADEFDGTTLQGKKGSALVCDVRPFGKRQAEAVDFYIQNIIRTIESGEPPSTDAESVLVLCDRGTCLKFSTIESYTRLWRAGFPIKIEQKRRLEPSAFSEEWGSSRARNA
jgi:hypothetical protein